MRIDERRAEMIVKMLCEGSSVRATARLVGVDPHTVLDLLVLVGGRCQRFLEAELRDLAVDELQCDEAWQFIFCKDKTRERKGYDDSTGDSYVFTAIERHTKLLVVWHLGKRDQSNTDAFCRKLRAETAGKFLVSTDGFRPYRTAIPHYLGDRADFGVLVKTFGEAPKDERRKYSPAKITSIRKEQVWNLPDKDRICTSHCERHNLNLRTFIRRMTRLSNGFSKKWENHEAMLALYFCHYNFCRTHGTLKTTPAVAAGLTRHRWTVREMLEKTATC